MSGDGTPAAPSDPRRRSPFALGFFGAIGVLVALALSEAVAAVQSVLVLVVLAFVLALGASPVVDFLDRRMPRPLAMVLVPVVVLGVLALGLFALVPLLMNQGTQLVANLPKLLGNLLDHERVREFNEQFGVIDKLQSALTDAKLADTLVNGLMGAGAVVVNFLFSVLITAVLTIYFMGSLGTIKQLVYDLAPASRRDRAKYIADGIFQGVSGYVRGMIIEVTISTIVAFIVLQLFGLHEYAVALAFVYGLLCFIPVAGPPTAAVLLSLVAFSISIPQGLGVAIVFIIYQQFDAYLIYPTIMGRTVRVPGVLVVLSAIMGGILMGIIGAVLAVPTAAALLLVWREVIKPALDVR